LLTRNFRNRGLGFWSAPYRELLGWHRLQDGERLEGSAVMSNRVLLVLGKGGQLFVDTLSFEGTHERLGTVDLGTLSHDIRNVSVAVDLPLGRSIWVSTGHEVFAIGLDEHDLADTRRVVKQDDSIRYVVDDPLDRFFVTVDSVRRIRLWDLTGTSPARVLEGPPLGRPTYVRITEDGSLLSARTELESGNHELWLWSLDDDEPRLVRRLDFGKTGQTYDRFDPTGTRVAKSGRDPKTRIWSTAAPADADPLVLAHSDASVVYWPNFGPQGRWLATADAKGLSLWPLKRPYPFVIRRHTASVYGLTFGPNGQWLASSSWDGTVRLWPLEGRVPAQGREIFRSPPGERQLCTIAATPDGESFVVGTLRHGVWLIPRSPGDPRRLVGFLKGAAGVSLSPDGRYAAATGGQWDESESLVRVWDVASGAEVAVLQREDRPYPWAIKYTEGGQVFCAGDSGLLRWDLETGESKIVYRGIVRQFAASSSGKKIVVTTLESDSEDSRTAVFLDLESGVVTPLTRHGDVGAVALDPKGTIVVTSSVDGIIRVGSVAGEKPHLLFKHDGVAYALALDPLGRWIASAGQDGTVRLWPMPDLSKPPLHTLPRDELTAKFETLTNLRVVRDEESSTGWKLTHDPFPGWAEVPDW
jgi:WD40 repeat protein